MNPNPENDEFAALVREYQQSGDRRARNELVERHRHVAEFYAKRYKGRGVPMEDLSQLGLLAMVRAVDRFDPERGVSFTTFASRTVEGELKRHFRDHSWTVRPPRATQELHLEIRAAEEILQQRLRRSPTPRELAEELGETVDHVLEAMESAGAHTAAPIDHPDSGDEDPAPRAALSQVEKGFDAITDTVLVDELLERLSEREQRILRMRFYDNMTQPEIAEVMGVSQSYLSRMLRAALLKLRTRLADAESDEVG